MAAPDRGRTVDDRRLPSPPPCAHPAYNPDWWFAPENEEDTGRRLTTDADAEMAARICETQCDRACRAACLAGAKARRERFGVWGGVLFAGGRPTSLAVLRAARRKGAAA